MIIADGNQTMGERLQLLKTLIIKRGSQLSLSVLIVLKLAGRKVVF